MPNDFIPAAERTGIVQHLDRMMLDRACEILPQLRQLGSAAEKLFISVNMSGINFGVADVLQTVKNILAAHDADPACIKLEVTESALIGDPEAAENTLNDLRALGLETALDDFGTGYSSLSYLHRFAFDTIKIDRAFVMGLNEEGSRSVDIVRAVIALARNFGLSVVAEGVEEDEDAQILKALGCDMAQGYLYSKPLPVEDALAFTRKNLGL
jgi:EAL domain-containing protein (putative c-di-GMP-specific phosphodiesterase class I)